MKRKILIADDSPFMRGAIKRALEADGRFVVTGEAADGAQAVALAASLHPDAITMDVNMPRLDGIAAVRRIMAEAPCPIVMLSAHTRAGAEATVDALAAGALDFVAKPSGEVSADLARVSAELCEKLAAAATAHVRGLHGVRHPAPAPAPKAPPAAPAVSAGNAPHLGVIASSTGGPQALTALFSALPEGLPLALLVVQHLPAQLTTALAARLDGVGGFRVREARHGDAPSAGVALVAPGGLHLDLSPAGAAHLSASAPLHGVRPAADITMRAAARVFGARTLGVVLTGMGRDGAEGLLAIRAAGGTTIAQDQASSVVYGMPRAASEAGAAGRVASLDDIPRLVIDAARGLMKK